MPMKKRRLLTIVLLFPFLCGIALFSDHSRAYGAGEPPAAGQQTAEMEEGESLSLKAAHEKGKTASISGRIVDSGRQPVESVVVAINVSPFSETTTDKDGTFVLPAVPQDQSVPLEIFKEGYYPQFTTVRVTKAEGASFSLTLVPTPPTLPVVQEAPVKSAPVQEVQSTAGKESASKDKDPAKAQETPGAKEPPAKARMDDTVAPAGSGVQTEPVKSASVQEVPAAGEIKGPPKDKKKGRANREADAKEKPQAKAPVDDAVHIEADTLGYDMDTDTYHAKGNVVITYTDGILSAVMVDVDRKTNEALAEGQVVLQSRDGDVLEGEKARLDIEKKTGVVEHGQVFVSKTHMYILGDRIERRSESTYFVVNAQLTSCDGLSPAWHFAGKELDVTVDGYGTLTNSKFYAKNTPVFYSPYLLFPVKTTRQTGLLLPERMSYSQNKLGMDVSVPFFWAISQDTDATFYQRYMSARGYQQGAEYRYSLSKDIYGTIYADFLQDQKQISETVGNLTRDWKGDQNRWSLYMNHEARFDKTMYFRADIAKVSDSFYFKDFSSYNYFLANYAGTRPQAYKRISFMADESLSTIESNLRFVKAWEAYSLAARVRDVQDLTVASNDVTLQKYPEITLAGMKQSLFGTRAQYELSGVYDYFYRGQGQKGNLLDVYPTLSMPVRLGDYAMLTPFSGMRSLAWTRDDNVSDGAGKQGNLQIYTFGGTASSEVSRIFDIGTKSMDKIRHAVRPEVTYIYSPNTDQNNIPDFIPAATQQNAITSAMNKVLGTSVNGGIAATAPIASDQNSITYGVTNTLVARIWDEKGKKRYLEFFRFKATQTYDFKEANRDILLADTNRKPLSDIALEVDFRPVTYLTFLARDKYNVYNANWSQANYDLILNNKRGDSASLTYRYTQDSIEETNLILKAVLTKSVNLLVRFKRDHFNHRDVERMVGFDYRSQCWAVGFDYGERNNDRTYAIRFAIHGM